MGRPVIAGGSEAANEAYGDVDAVVDEQAGEWVTCPDCGSGDAVMIWWEKSDMDYRCPDCDAHHGVR